MENKYSLPQRYSLRDLGVSGGMGDILSCVDSHLDRKVIIKILKNNEEERRLLDEQKALLKLRSKHVVQLYDIIDIVAGGKTKTGLVLEFIEGSDLEFNIEESVEDKLKKLWQIACGLNDIHSAGIIHRDIKPSNIRLDENNIIKILDFGLARTSGDDASTHSVIGTLGYMAPELWKRRNIHFDSSIDVYAFGVVAFDLFGIDKPDELYEQPPAPVKQSFLSREFSKFLPSDLVTVLSSCLSYDKSQRPTMESVKDIIAKHLLKNKHRALFVLNNKIYELNARKKDVAVTWGGGSQMKIEYDGFDFKITSFSGDVTVNNQPVTLNKKFPSCSVITLINGSSRTFVTFDISRPEVMS
ncbi:serine/threonine-protein kinase [Aeromonas enteropelogenes]|uniref:serine/threonine-protein kinase n=1 Tax=Aeromonas enteropelogenes TaxID=29489 RepID=UPI0038D207E4